MYPLLFSIPKDRFIAPEGYFEHLSANLNLKEISQSEQFETPEMFFEEQHMQIQKRVEDEVNKELDVPADFFNDMHREIMQTVEETPQERSEAIVVSMSSSKQWPYWLAAACILGAIAWFSLTGSGSDEECITFACLLEQTEFTTDDLLFIDDTDLLIEQATETESIQMIEFQDDEILDYLDEEDLEELLLEE